MCTSVEHTKAEEIAFVVDSLSMDFKKEVFVWHRPPVVVRGGVSTGAIDDSPSVLDTSRGSQ